MVIKKYQIGLVIILIGILIGVYFLFNPADSEFFPQCPFHTITGYDCPGCGSQRAIHNLLHFHFLQALHYNALLVVAIPYISLGLYMEYFGGNTKYPALRRRLFGRKAVAIVFITIVLFWIIRNFVGFI